VTFLEKILASRREAVLRMTKEQANFGRVDTEVRDFRKALATPGMSLIAEIKRASPSRGDLNPELEPASLARSYEAGGARALSVLVEPEFFKGSEADLRRARDATSLPTLWKDFVISPVQVAQASRCGADAVLVIVRILSDAEMHSIMDIAGSLGLCPLVEIFDETDLERALAAGADVVGVNHRDLETFEEDPSATARLRELIPDDVILVAESAISSREDVAALEAIGVHAMLVGEAIVTAPDPEKKIRELLGS
jgi:indole-3-glycerol phosphate synthase